MAYKPRLKPLFDGGGAIDTEIVYDKRLTGVNDKSRDGNHIHDFYEIYINLDGDVSFLVEDHLYPISRGDVIVTAPNEIHRCIYHSDCLHEHFCIWVRDLPAMSEQERLDFEQHKLRILSPERKERLIRVCFDLYEGMDGGKRPAFCNARCFFEVLELLSTGEHNVTEIQSLPTGFREIIDYISLHCFESTCTTTHICDVFFISKSTLCRKFQQYFQMTPSCYIEARRFAEAKKLLGMGRSVQDACLNSGFSDCSYFIMRFRKKFGITPYKYQKDGT